VKRMLNELVAVREQIAVRVEYYDKAIANLQEQRALALGAELPALESGLVKNIKAMAISIKHTVKGTQYNKAGLGQQAVWSKGRTSWDTKGLVGLIPEVQDEELRQKFSDCQKTGKPSVSIRIVKKAEKVEEVGSLF